MVTPSLSHLVVPIALVILIGLFMVQRFGTGAVGWLFGPVIGLWFVVIAVLGAHQVVLHPDVLQALSPTCGARFMFDHGVDAFLVLGGVVLCVTGAEALYADRGHFGAGPIRFTWFVIVLPAVLLNYLGQAALVQSDPSTVSNPFYLLAPHSMQLPLVVLATLATIIASQAALTGSFSVAKQALQLGLLPRIKIVNTSNVEGQIYVPMINWFLCAGVAALVLIFQDSAKLTEIYGVAVTGTFILNTILFAALSRAMWKTPWWRLGPLVVVFLIVEVSFFAANLTKIDHGAWLSLAVGLAFAFIMLTWRQGRRILTANRIEEEGSLEAFLASLPDVEPPLDRVPGTAIYLAPTTATTPLALRAEVEHNHVLHETVLIATIEPVSISHVELLDRCAFAWLGSGRFKVGHITLHVGYRDHIDVPRDLALARKRGLLPRNLDLEHASYFVSRMQIIRTKSPGMAPWRKALFVFMARNASSPVDDFSLPEERTVLMGQQIRLLAWTSEPVQRGAAVREHVGQLGVALVERELQVDVGDHGADAQRVGAGLLARHPSVGADDRAAAGPRLVTFDTGPVSARHRHPVAAGGAHRDHDLARALPVRAVHQRPVGRHQQQLRAGQRDDPGQLRELDVVTDDHR